MKDLMKPYQKTPQLNTLRYPVIATPKLDGIRCAIENGVARTFNKKSVPNVWVNEILAACGPLIEGFDGELMVSDGDFNRVQSGIMTHGGQPNFKFMVFDLHDSPMPYKHRIEQVHKRITELHSGEELFTQAVQPVEAKICRNEMELKQYWTECIELGYEGVIVNDPEGLYKNGRSGLKEQLSVKLKRWHDDEAVIIGFEEEVALDGTPKGRVGRVTMKHSSGVVFGVGGLTDEIKAHMWNKPEWYIGKRATFKYQDWPLGGAPRFPGWKGVRYD
jgi:DNA ligase 1